MEHTLLLQTGRWKASGSYVDEEQRRFTVEGVATVVHQEKVWMFDCQWQMAGPDQIRIQSRYAFPPVAEGQEVIGWICQHSRFKRLDGRFALLGDTILSLFQGQEGEVSGSEALQQITDDSYQSRGVIYDGPKRSAAWVVKLTRVG